MSREQRHAHDPYWEFYDADAQETAAWLNGAEWARDPEDREDACDCGEGHPVCVFCHEPLCCGPDIAACDAADHCELCLHECALCRRAMREERR